MVFIKQQLDQYLINRFELEDDIAVLNHLVGQDGSVLQKNQNKMVPTLINLDHETAKQFYGARPQSNQGASQTRNKVNPPIHFNLDLLLTASFDDYEEALKLLNATIAFFQINLTFNKQTSPNLPQGINRLDFEVENTTYFEMHNFWSAMGAKYQPSVIY